MVLAFTTVTSVLGKSALRGMTALFIGLAIGLVGMDQISGQARYTAACPSSWMASRWCWWRWACSPWARCCTPRCTGAAGREPERR